MKRQKRVAAIDIGSNSILLTIAECGSPHPIPLKLITEEAHITSLAKNLGPDLSIKQEAEEKSLSVLKQYSDLISKNAVDEIRVVATEALRKAKNGAMVKAKIENLLKKPVELIPGDREAELSFWSVQKEFPDTKIEKIVFDIGGASTELCHGNASGIQHRVSLKVGSVLLTEKFHLQNRSRPDEASRFVRQLIRDVPWTSNVKNSIGIGVAGTMTTLLAMEYQLKDYDRNQVHQKSLSKSHLEFWMNEILLRDLSERKGLTGLPFDRADVFGGGLIIAHALLDFFQWPELICMDSGVRFGLLYEMLEI